MRYLISLVLVILLGLFAFGCHPKMNTMAKAEKIFIKMVDHTAAKLDLTADQKIQLEQLKLNIRKNFQEGQIEKKEVLVKIKEEGIKENPDIGKMTSLLERTLRDETQRINRAFDLMLGFEKNLNENQQKKLRTMISEWVAKWD
jgi:ATP-dependent protease HslVU (ClpYQ) ATPase subunit